MNRRGFLSAILAAGVAPAVMRHARAMPVRTLEREWVEVCYDAVDPRAVSKAIIFEEPSPLFYGTIRRYSGFVLCQPGGGIFARGEWEDDTIMYVPVAGDYDAPR